ncbi:MAG: DMT family transporter [Flavobacteriales bacterium]|nr:DMT family transporter [Flavobacteriales bacterium]
MSKRTLSWVLLVFLALIWGSSFILMKRAMFTIDGAPLFSDSQVGALRMFLAALALLPFSIKHLSTLRDWGTIGKLAIVGFCGNFFPAFLFTYAETGISSGYAGMLNSCTPIFAILIGAFIFKDRLTRIQIIGISIGTAGVISLMLAGQDLSISGNWTHVIAVVIATLCYAISLNTIRHTLSHLKSVQIASLAFLITFLPSTFLIWKQDVLGTLTSTDGATEGLIAVIILSVIGTAFALIVFNRVIALSSVVFASSVTYLIPIVAVIIGISFGETINLWQILSMGVVISGVFIANAPKRRKLKTD